MRQILDSPILKEFADDNFKFDESGRRFTPMRIENTVGKGEIARYKQLLLSQCFKRLKLQTHKKTGLVWERVNCPSQISSLILFILHFHFFLLLEKALINCTREVAKC